MREAHLIRIWFRVCVCVCGWVWVCVWVCVVCVCCVCVCLSVCVHSAERLLFEAHLIRGFLRLMNQAAIFGLMVIAALLSSVPGKPSQQYYKYPL